MKPNINDATITDKLERVVQNITVQNYTKERK
jgi:hypothetical protein